MTIWYVDSTGVVNHAPEATPLNHAPEATPLKKACINSCIAALTKIAVPVKSACRNSYDCGSAAFAKVDRTVRTVRLRRRPAGGETGGAYEKIPAEEVEEQEGLIPEPVKTNACSDGGAGKSVSYSYGFLTFAKIGYIVRVKVVCRIVQRISDDGTKSSVIIYDTDFAHESDDGGKPILGDHDSVENEPKKLFGTRTIAEMVDGIKKWMSDPVINARIIIYTSMLMDNVRCYGLLHGLAPNRAAVSTILTQTLADVAIDLVNEMADSREQLSSGSQESKPEVETDDKWYSSLFEFLKEKVGIIALSEILFFVVREFSAFLRTEPFRTQCYSERMFTVEYLVLMMGKFLEFVKKRHCSAGFYIVQAIVMALVRKMMCDRFVNERGFHGTATKGTKTKNKKKKKKKKVDSQGQHSSGSQESNPEVEMDDKRYTSVFEFLKEALNKIYFFAVREFSAFLRTEPFRTQCYSERMFTVERHCGGDSMEQQQKGRRRRIRRRRRRRRRLQFEC